MYIVHEAVVMYDSAARVSLCTSLLCKRQHRCSSGVDNNYAAVINLTQCVSP
jgi:hypothetical protein